MSKKKKMSILNFLTYVLILGTPLALTASVILITGSPTAENQGGLSLMPIFLAYIAWWLGILKFATGYPEIFNKTAVKSLFALLSILAAALYMKYAIGPLI